MASGAIAGIQPAAGVWQLLTLGPAAKKADIGVAAAFVPPSGIATAVVDFANIVVAPVGTLVGAVPTGSAVRARIELDGVPLQQILIAFDAQPVFVMSDGGNVRFVAFQNEAS